jgi:hypothetical protein
MLTAFPCNARQRIFKLVEMNSTGLTLFALFFQVSTALGGPDKHRYPDCDVPRASFEAGEILALNSAICEKMLGLSAEECSPELARARNADGEPLFHDPADPWEPRVIHKREGSLKNREWVDIRFRRNLRLLTDEESRAYGGPIPGKKFYANFRHKNRFWVAAIPDEPVVEKVIYQKEWFGPQPHAQMRIQLKPGHGIEIFAQPMTIGINRRTGKISGETSISDYRLTPNDPSLRETITDITYTAEAAPVYGDSMGAHTFGLGIAYPIALRVISTEQSFDEVVNGANHTVEQYDLNAMTDQQKTRLLRGLVHTSASTASDSYFFLASSNCMTNLMDPIDHALYSEYPDQVRSKLFNCEKAQPEMSKYDRSKYSGPNAGDSEFVARGLIDSKKKSTLPNMNKEPELQRFKRRRSGSEEQWEPDV